MLYTFKNKEIIKFKIYEKNGISVSKEYTHDGIRSKTQIKKNINIFTKYFNKK